MKVLKTTAALTLVGFLTACGSTSKPTTLAEVNNYSGSFADHRSYALNLMEAAELGGAKDVKLKDGDSVIDLAGSNASFGFVDSLASGGSLLTAGLSGLAGGLLTPDSDAQYNNVIALVEVSDLEPNTNVNSYARKALLEKFSVFFTDAIGADVGTAKIRLYNDSSSFDTFAEMGRYGAVYTDDSTEKKCEELSNELIKEMNGYGQPVNESAFDNETQRLFDGNCGMQFYSIKVKDKVTSSKLPWLDEGKEYVVVTAQFGGASVSYNHLAESNINVDGLYLYYTSNGANVGKAKDTEYPYIQAPHGKEIYFIKP